MFKSDAWKPKRIPINELTKRSHAHAHAHNKITTTHKNYCIQWNLEHHSLPLVACFASFRYITCKSLCSFHFYDLNISYEASYYWYVLFSSFVARSYFLILSISYSVCVSVPLNRDPVRCSFLHYVQHFYATTYESTWAPYIFTM